MGTDDDIRHGGGPISYWLKYKLTELGGTPGWVVLLVLLIAGAIGWLR